LAPSAGTVPSRGWRFSKHVVLRYRIELESRHLAASTINVLLPFDQ
jgi:hypothetical protein